MKNIITLLLLTLLCLALNAQENNASKKAKDLIDGMDELLDDLDNLLDNLYLPPIPVKNCVFSWLLLRVKFS